MSEDNRFERAVQELADAIWTVESNAREKLTKEQLAAALKQAIACGDFLQLLEVQTGNQQVTYVPYRREQELKKRIATLEGETFDLSEELLRAKTRIADLEAENSKIKAAWQQSDGARKGWLNEFDGYKLQILRLKQLVAEARVLIGIISASAPQRAEVVKAAQKWLEKTP